MESVLRAEARWIEHYQSGMASACRVLEAKTVVERISVEQWPEYLKQPGKRWAWLRVERLETEVERAERIVPEELVSTRVR